MKILYLVSSTGIFKEMKGGAGTHIRGTIKGFEENGFEVITFIEGDFIAQANLREKKTRDASNKKKRNIIIRKIQNIGRDIKTHIRFKSFERKLDHLISEERPDFIYERSCIYATYGGRLARKYNIPHFLETSGCLVELFDAAYGLTSIGFANYLERKKLLKSNCIVTEADSAINYVNSKFNLSNNKIVSKPLGVEIKRNIVDIQSINQLKNKYSILPTDKVIGYVGTFASYHKMERFLSVFEQTRDLNIKYLLVGDGGNFQIINDFVSNNNLKNVILTGYIKEGVDNFMNVMDLGLVPDCEEHMAPIKFYEYGLYDITPIVPNYYAFDNILKEGINGFIFEPNVKNIVNLIEKIHSLDISIIKQMGQKWHDFVTSNYSWKTVVRNVINEMNKLNENSSYKR